MSLSAWTADWVATLGAIDVPALPELLWMQWGLRMGWGMVCSWLLVQVVQAVRDAAARRRQAPAAPLPAGARALLCLVTVGLMALPGPASPAFWLGLAFQLPSGVTVLLCTASVWRHGGRRDDPRTVFGLSLLAVALGWVLLLDTFALLPWQVYAWGFSPAAVLLVGALSILPWLAGTAARAPLLTYGLPLVVLAYAVVRLPSGNVWDAMLDPWLWLAAHVQLLRLAASGWRRRSR